MRHSVHRSTTYMLLGSALALVVPSAVLAQTEGRPGEDGEAVEASEIVVYGQQGDGYDAGRITTATRTGTAIRDIPQSIQVVTRDVIDDQQVVDLNDAVRNVSGLQPGTQAGNRSESFTIRGFRSSYYAVDSVVLSPVADVNDTYRDMANIERIEVLKGPASVLYGRGDPGGLVNIVTRQPLFRHGMDMSVQAGSNRFVRGQASFTGPIDTAQTLAFRLSAAAQTSDTFRDLFEPARRQFVAPALLWTPTPRTRFVVSGAYTAQQVQSDRGIVAAPVVGAPTGRLVVDLPRERYLGDAFATLKSSRREVTYRFEQEIAEWLTFRQIGHYDEGELDLFGYNHRGVSINARNRRMSARQATRQTETNGNYDFQGDLVAKFSTGAIRHTVVLGGEYVKADRKLKFYRATLAAIDIDRPVYGLSPGVFSLTNDRVAKAKVFAAYVQDQVDIGDRLKILAGVRYDDLTQSNAAVGSVSRADERNFSPRVGIVWKPLDEISLFADYTRSFQPNLGIAIGGGALPPETGVQYEAGIKAGLLDDRLSVTLAAYQLTRGNVANSDTRNPGFQINVGQQRSRGVEMDVSGELAKGLKLIASGAYMKARILSSADEALFRTGNFLINAPRWTGSLWASYDAPEGYGLGAGVFGASRRQGNFANNFTLDGYVRADATLWYDLAKGLRLSVTGKNLFDRYYMESAQSEFEVYPASGRTMLVGVAVTL